MWLGMGVGMGRGGGGGDGVRGNGVDGVFGEGSGCGGWRGGEVSFSDGVGDGREIGLV